MNIVIQQSALTAKKMKMNENVIINEWKAHWTSHIVCVVPHMYIALD